MKNSLRLIPIALICAILLFSQEIQTVFADAIITVITPTGGGLVSTADCTDITANTIVWLNCSDTQKLFAISQTTHAVLANITTSGALNTLQASLSGSSVFLNNPTANTVTKYIFSGGIISQQAIWTAPCNIDTNLNYDNSGFLWNTCSPTDQIVRLNPNTMTTDTLASTGGTCVTPDKIHYTSNGNKGIVHCTNGGSPDTIIMFSRTSSTAIAVLDTETTTSGTVNVMIDGAHLTVLAPSGSVMSVWTYTTGGLLTLSQTLTGNIFDQCDIEPFNIVATQELFALCEAYSAPNTLVTGFMINSTATFQVFNGAVTYSDASAIGYDISFGSPPSMAWYISANTNNEKYLLVEGIRTLGNTDPEEPEPPNGGSGGGTGGVDCGNPANANLVICRLGGNGTITSAGDFLIGDPDSGIGIVPIICSTGIVDCVENPDMKTNGAGLLITLVILAIAIGVFWVATRGDLTSIPVFIWMILVLCIFGFATLAGLIDLTILLLSVVVIVGLASAKIKGLLSGEFR